MSATATGEHEGGREVRRRSARLPARLLRLASDERLVDALRGGSEAAFEVLYTRHHRGVLSFCRHMLGSVEEAEDAVQHTFLAAYRDLLRSGKPVQLRPWLYTIARNRCLSVLRARRERTSDEPLEPSTEHLAQEVERRHDLRALLGDVAELPHDQRAALVLAELGDMSHDEIGDVLGCPREKVKALVFQARSSLITSRNARETPCADVREQLANLRGGALRRNSLRRHLRECPGCRDFRDQVIAQRSALALILPVAPSLGLKATVLGAAGVTAAGGGSAAVVAGVVAVCVAGGGTAAVNVARDDPGTRARSSEPRPVRAEPVLTRPAVPAALATPGPRTQPATAPPGRAEKRRGPKRRPPRAAAVAPVAAGHEADLKPGKGNGPDRMAARPPRAQGPKPKAARPVQVPGPNPRSAKPVKAPRSKAPKAAHGQGARPAKPGKAPAEPAAEAPGPPAELPPVPAEVPGPPVDPPRPPAVSPGKGA
jgi:RNA polymerase sigma factor (sigma-70 family)